MLSISLLRHPVARVLTACNRAQSRASASHVGQTLSNAGLESAGHEGIIQRRFHTSAMWPYCRAQICRECVKVQVGSGW